MAGSGEPVGHVRVIIGRCAEVGGKRAIIVAVIGMAPFACGWKLPIAHDLTHDNGTATRSRVTISPTRFILLYISEVETFSALAADSTQDDTKIISCSVFLLLTLFGILFLFLNAKVIKN